MIILCFIYQRRQFILLFDTIKDKQVHLVVVNFNQGKIKQTKINDTKIYAKLLTQYNNLNRERKKRERKREVVNVYCLKLKLYACMLVHEHVRASLQN